jgi:hypothetical protein
LQVAFLLKVFVAVNLAARITPLKYIEAGREHRGDLFVPSRSMAKNA